MSNDNWTSNLKPEDPSVSVRNWTLIQRQNEEGIPMTLFAAIAFIVFILFAAMACGLIRLCRKEDTTPYDERPQYSVAISNRLFKDDASEKDLPCLNCRLIEMGEMACYEETCPQCGQVPPSKKLMYEAYERKKRQLEQKRKKQLQQVAASRAAVRSNAASASMDSKLPESGHNGKGTTTAAVIVQNSKDVAEAAKSNNAVV